MIQSTKSKEIFLTQAQYNARETAGTLVPGTIYHITDAKVELTELATTIQASLGKADTAAQPAAIVTTLPATLSPNTVYDLGEVATLALTLPATGAIGDFMVVDFISGTTATTLTITSTAPLSTYDLVPLANKVYEIYVEWIKLDASNYGWGINYAEFTKATA